MVKKAPGTRTVKNVPAAARKTTAAKAAVTAATKGGAGIGARNSKNTAAAKKIAKGAGSLRTSPATSGSVLDNDVDDGDDDDEGVRSFRAARDARAKDVKEQKQKMPTYTVATFTPGGIVNFHYSGEDKESAQKAFDSNPESRVVHVTDISKKFIRHRLT